MSEYAGDRATRIKERDSDASRKWMRLFTTLSLTHSDGYVLFGDDNAQPVGDHLHNWYDFWDAELGTPLAPGTKQDDGSYRREFSHGTAVFNPPSNAQVTIHFDESRASVATARTGTSHTVAPGDGDLFLTKKEGTARK